MNLPNAISAGRIAVCPLIFYLTLAPGTTSRYAAFFLFLVAAFSDIWDGYLARKYGWITDMGTLLDPVADKLLLASTFVPIYIVTRRPDELSTLPWWGAMPLWVMVVVLGRELLVTLFRSYAARHGIVISAGKSGKFKTLVQNCFVGGSLFWFPILVSATERGWSGDSGTSGGPSTRDWWERPWPWPWGSRSFPWPTISGDTALWARAVHDPASSGADTGPRVTAARLSSVATATGLKIATAESCTGGLVAKTLTDLPGSSACYLGGVVAYANDVKVRQLGVDPDLLESTGAVSRPVALQMAQGALQRFSADVAMSVTGIAGPGGGTPANPVGTVWMAVALANGSARAQRFRFAGDRDAVRERSVAEVLGMALEAIAGRGS